MLNTVLGSFSSGVAAATASYESIASATGTGSSATITFSAIPATYTHLQVRYNARDAAALNAEVVVLRFNGVTGTSYASHALQGNGSTATTVQTASANGINRNFQIASANATANIMGVGIIDILDYASTTKTKTIKAIAGVDLNSATTDAQIRLSSGLFNSTNAITSISFVAPANFTTSTTFALYGIKG